MSDWCPENDGAYRAEMAAMYPVANRKRIAELEAEYSAFQSDVKEREVQFALKMGKLEAKLAKAVDVLGYYAWENEARLPSEGPWGVASTDFGQVARATLAELKGGKDD